MKVLELFAGGGGLSLGFEGAGLPHAALIELDRDCVNTLRINRPDWEVIHADVKDIDFSIYKGIDILAGGFPCQSFSYAGKRLGLNDLRGNLVYQFIRAIKESQPKCFLGENVKGLFTIDNGETFKAIMLALKDLGYVVCYKLLNAVNYNVPQKRERLIIVGFREDLNVNYEFPTPSHNIITLRQTLKDCPESPCARYTPQREQVMKLVPPGGCWVNLPIDVQREYMGAAFYSGGGKRGVAKRLHWDEPCPTLLTSPSQKLTERCHPTETRPLSIREYARVQTFPDDWIFTGSIASQYKQIGNAIPVQLGKSLALSIRSVFEYEPGNP
jgi:DNA (cytosine-5)-methyltransferase 1